jgi:hypothetical protein
MSHRDNGHFRGHRARVLLANRTKEFSELIILANRRPRSLNEFTAQSGIPAVSNRATLGSLSGGALRGHQPQKGWQLADTSELTPVPDAGHQLASHDPANAGRRLQISDTARQLGVVLAKAANLAGSLKDLLLTKLQTVEQLIDYPGLWKLRHLSKACRTFDTFSACRDSQPA